MYEHPKFKQRELRPHKIQKVVLQKRTLPLTPSSQWREISVCDGLGRIMYRKAQLSRRV